MTSLSLLARNNNPVATTSLGRERMAPEPDSSSRSTSTAAVTDRYMYGGGIDPPRRNPERARPPDVVPQLKTIESARLAEYARTRMDDPINQMRNNMLSASQNPQLKGANPRGDDTITKLRMRLLTDYDIPYIDLVKTKGEREQRVVKDGRFEPPPFNSRLTPLPGDWAPNTNVNTRAPRQSILLTQHGNAKPLVPTVGMPSGNHTLMNERSKRKLADYNVVQYGQVQMLYNMPASYVSVGENYERRHNANEGRDYLRTYAAVPSDRMVFDRIPKSQNDRFDRRIIQVSSTAELASRGSVYDERNAIGKDGRDDPADNTLRYAKPVPIYSSVQQYRPLYPTDGELDSSTYDKSLRSTPCVPKPSPFEYLACPTTLVSVAR